MVRSSCKEKEGSDFIRGFIHLPTPKDIRTVVDVTVFGRDFTPSFVRPSVGQSVGPSHLTLSLLFCSLTSLLLPKRSRDLKYRGSHVSGLV